MRVCRTCKVEKDESEFYVNKRNKDNLEYHCKECIKVSTKVQRNKRLADSRSAKIEKKKQDLLDRQNATEKVCYTCKATKPLVEFNKHKQAVDGLHPSCTECKNAKAKERRKLNIESVRARDREYRHKNKDKKSLSDKKYREANKATLKTKKQEYYKENQEILSYKNKLRRINLSREDKLNLKTKSHNRYKNRSEKEKENRKEYGKYYHKTPTGMLSSRNSRGKRRANILSGLDGTVTSQALETLKEKQNNKCYHCEVELDFSIKGTVNLDHYIPLSKGGLHSITNVVWSCASCNKSKGNKMPKAILDFDKFKVETLPQ